MKVLVVCAQRYNGHELWTALGVMGEAGFDFEVISTSLVISDEVTGKPNSIQRTIAEVDDVTEFDGLMIVSGNMKDTEAYWNDPKVLGFVRTFADLDKPIAAICCSVPTVRKVAEGRRVSFYPLVRSRDLLTQAGAILQTVAATVDGKLVTAEHQMATQIWAEAFVEVMKGNDPGLNLVDSGYRPMGRERKPIPELERLKRTSR